MKKILLVVTLGLLCASCVKEENVVASCGKWQVEINNPEATVKVENGKLIIDIENPKSAKDVRLIQLQDPAVNSPEIGLAVAIADFKWVGVNNAPSRDAQISASVAYASSPNAPFIYAVNGADKSTYYIEGAEVFSRLEGNGRINDELMFFASNDKVAFERDSRTFPAKPLSVASKIVYLDFGINTAITREYPTQSIHIELDIIIFGQYTGNQNPIELPTGFNPSNYGFSHDQFDCNSLKQ